MVTIHVKKSDPSVDPIVVSFPGGLPEGCQEGSIADPPKFLWRKARDASNKLGRTVVGKDDTCFYQGQSTDDDHRRTKLCVGILRKGKLTLYPAAERGSVFCLTQSVPSYVESEASDKLTAMQRRKALFEDFGSQKKRKVMKSQEANRVNVESVIGAGSLMMGALKAGAMSESNRAAMAASKSGTKVS
jgi:A49-like RNA polymerase I associated factor